MQCPNCGDMNYQQGARCAACQWQPANDREFLQQEKQRREEVERQEFKEKLLAAVVCLLFFLFIFWFFPSGRYAHDWFELTFWECIWAMILATFCFSMMFKK